MTLPELSKRGWSTWKGWPFQTVNGLPHLAGTVLKHDGAGLCLMRTKAGDRLVHRDWLIPLRGKGVMALPSPPAEQGPAQRNATERRILEYV